MAQKEILGKMIEFDDEGYFVHSDDWSEEIAKEIAKENGFELTDEHLKVLKWMREQTANGKTLSIRAIGKSGIVDVKTFYKLFPGAPLKLATKYAGLKKPQSCI